MRHYIVAKARGGWAVAHEADVLETFASLEAARAHAEALCALAATRGERAEVIDLAEAEGAGILLPRREAGD